MKCSTGKREYESEHQALDALVEHRARNNHREGSGPVNIYHCDDCHFWHFTSKGEQHPSLSSREIKERSKIVSEAAYWESRLRK